MSFAHLGSMETMEKTVEIIENDSISYGATKNKPVLISHSGKGKLIYLTAFMPLMNS